MDTPSYTELDLAGDDEDKSASSRGLLVPSTLPPPEDTRAVALSLLRFAGLCTALIVVLATVTAFVGSNNLKEMIAFYTTIIATLGTLLGGVVAFYFARR